MSNYVRLEGETIRSICNHCEEMRESVFRIRNLSMCDGRYTIKDIMVSVCNTCDNITGIPAQSTPSIKEQMETFRKYEYVYTM
jgi:hypothetical protein